MEQLRQLLVADDERARAARARRVRWLTPITTMDTTRLRSSGAGRPWAAEHRVQGRPPLLVVRQDLQFDGEIDLAHADAAGHGEHRRGEVEDARDPGRTSRSAASWAAPGGVAITPIDTWRGLHDLGADRRCDARATPPRTVPTLVVVDVDDPGDREATVAEAAVAGERLAEVAGADDHDRPVVGRARAPAGSGRRGSRPRSRRRACRNCPGSERSLRTLAALTPASSASRR